MTATMLKIRRERIDEERKLKITTWALVPLNESCPYLFGAYDPESGLLRLESKHHKVHTQRFYQRDPKTNDILTNKNNLPFQPYVETDDNYFFFVIDNPVDIESALGLLCVNPLAWTEDVNVAPLAEPETAAGDAPAITNGLLHVEGEVANEPVVITQTNS